MTQEPEKKGVPADLLATLDAQLAARRSRRTVLTLEEHAGRLQGRWPLSRSEALSIGYSEEDVLRVFGPEAASQSAAQDAVSIVRENGRTRIDYGAFRLDLEGELSAVEVRAALKGFDAGVQTLASVIGWVMDNPTKG